MTDGHRRKKRHVRDSQPEPMVLTERDKQIIEAVYSYRCLRQDQIHSLFFSGSTSTSQRRLMLLYHHAYLNRVFLTSRASVQFSPVAYVLDKLGAEILRSEFGYSIDNLHSLPGQAGQQFLAHTLAVNDVRVSITLACRHQGCSILTWKGESELKADYDRVQISGKNGRRVSVSLIPDSFFILSTPLGRAHFFLELDRGQMGLDRFRGKIEAYRAYVQHGAYTRRYGAKTVRVLSVTLSEARLRNLQRTTETAGGRERFWFGILSELTPENILSGQVWSIAGHDEKFPLIQQEDETL